MRGTEVLRKIRVDENDNDPQEIRHRDSEKGLRIWEWRMEVKEDELLVVGFLFYGKGLIHFGRVCSLG